MTEPPFPAAFFTRDDESADDAFYQQPRFVTHIDDATIDALTAHYAAVIPSGAQVLDLMSSWVSHLPPSLALGRVAGLGMNAQELAGNLRLSDYLVHDLNRKPRLPYADDSFDCVLIAVSVQYLTKPLAVFADIARVLRAGGTVIIAMSHRCFPTKAIRAFHGINGDLRMQLAVEFLSRAGGFAPAQCIDRSPRGADPLWIVQAQTVS